MLPREIVFRGTGTHRSGGYGASLFGWRPCQSVTIWSRHGDGGGLTAHDHRLRRAWQPYLHDRDREAGSVRHRETGEGQTHAQDRKGLVLTASSSRGSPGHTELRMTQSAQRTL